MTTVAHEVDTRARIQAEEIRDYHLLMNRMITEMQILYRDFDISTTRARHERRALNASMQKEREFDHLIKWVAESERRGNLRRLRDAVRDHQITEKIVDDQRLERLRRRIELLVAEEQHVRGELLFAQKEEFQVHCIAFVGGRGGLNAVRRRQLRLRSADHRRARQQGQEEAMHRRQELLLSKRKQQQQQRGQAKTPQPAGGSASNLTSMRSFRHAGAALSASSSFQNSAANSMRHRSGSFRSNNNNNSNSISFFGANYYNNNNNDDDDDDDDDDELGSDSELHDLSLFFSSPTSLQRCGSSKNPQGYQQQNQIQRPGVHRLAPEDRLKILRSNPFFLQNHEVAESLLHDLRVSRSRSQRGLNKQRFEEDMAALQRERTEYERVAQERELHMRQQQAQDKIVMTAALARAFSYKRNANVRSQIKAEWDTLKNDSDSTTASRSAFENEQSNVISSNNNNDDGDEQQEEPRDVDVHDDTDDNAGRPQAAAARAGVVAPSPTRIISPRVQTALRFFDDEDENDDDNMNGGALLSSSIIMAQSLRHRHNNNNNNNNNTSRNDSSGATSITTTMTPAGSSKQQQRKRKIITTGKNDNVVTVRGENLGRSLAQYHQERRDMLEAIACVDTDKVNNFERDRWAFATKWMAERAAAGLGADLHEVPFARDATANLQGAAAAFATAAGPVATLAASISKCRVLSGKMKERLRAILHVNHGPIYRGYPFEGSLVVDDHYVPPISEMVATDDKSGRKSIISAIKQPPLPLAIRYCSRLLQLRKHISTLDLRSSTHPLDETAMTEVIALLAVCPHVLRVLWPKDAPPVMPATVEHALCLLRDNAGWLQRVYALCDVTDAIRRLPQLEAAEAASLPLVRKLAHAGWELLRDFFDLGQAALRQHVLLVQREGVARIRILVTISFVETGRRIAQRLCNEQVLIEFGVEESKRRWALEGIQQRERDVLHRMAYDAKQEIDIIDQQRERAWQEARKALYKVYLEQMALLRKEEVTESHRLNDEYQKRMRYLEKKELDRQRILEEKVAAEQREEKLKAMEEARKRREEQMAEISRQNVLRTASTQRQIFDSDERKARDRVALQERKEVETVLVAAQAELLEAQHRWDRHRERNAQLSIWRGAPLQFRLFVPGSKAQSPTRSSMAAAVAAGSSVASVLAFNSNFCQPGGTPPSRSRGTSTSRNNNNNSHFASTTSLFSPFSTALMPPDSSSASSTVESVAAAAVATMSAERIAASFLRGGLAQPDAVFSRSLLLSSKAPTPLIYSFNLTHGDRLLPHPATYKPLDIDVASPAPIFSWHTQKEQHLERAKSILQREAAARGAKMLGAARGSSPTKKAADASSALTRSHAAADAKASQETTAKRAQELAQQELEIQRMVLDSFDKEGEPVLSSWRQIKEQICSVDITFSLDPQSRLACCWTDPTCIAPRWQIQQQKKKAAASSLEQPSLNENDNNGNKNQQLPPSNDSNGDNQNENGGHGDDDDDDDDQTDVQQREQQRPQSASIEELLGDGIAPSPVVVDYVAEDGKLHFLLFDCHGSIYGLDDPSAHVRPPLKSSHPHCNRAVASMVLEPIDIASGGKFSAAENIAQPSILPPQWHGKKLTVSVPPRFSQTYESGAETADDVSLHSILTGRILAPRQCSEIVRWATQRIGVVPLIDPPSGESIDEVLPSCSAAKEKGRKGAANGKNSEERDNEDASTAAPTVAAALNEDETETALSAAAATTTTSDNVVVAATSKSYGSNNCNPFGFGDRPMNPLNSGLLVVELKSLPAPPVHDMDLNPAESIARHATPLVASFQAEQAEIRYQASIGNIFEPGECPPPRALLREQTGVFQPDDEQQNKESPSKEAAATSTSTPSSSCSSAAHSALSTILLAASDAVSGSAAVISSSPPALHLLSLQVRESSSRSDVSTCSSPAAALGIVAACFSATTYSRNNNNTFSVAALELVVQVQKEQQQETISDSSGSACITERTLAQRQAEIEDVMGKGDVEQRQRQESPAAILSPWKAVEQVHATWRGRVDFDIAAAGPLARLDADPATCHDLIVTRFREGNDDVQLFPDASIPLAFFGKNHKINPSPSVSMAVVLELASTRAPFFDPADCIWFLLPKTAPHERAGSFHVGKNAFGHKVLFRNNRPLFFWVDGTILRSEGTPIEFDEDTGLWPPIEPPADNVVLRCTPDASPEAVEDFLRCLVYRNESRNIVVGRRVITVSVALFHGSEAAIKDEVPTDADSISRVLSLAAIIDTEAIDDPTDIFFNWPSYAAGNKGNGNKCVLTLPAPNALQFVAPPPFLICFNARVDDPDTAQFENFALAGSLLLTTSSGLPAPYRLNSNVKFDKVCQQFKFRLDLCSLEELEAWAPMPIEAAPGAMDPASVTTVRSLYTTPPQPKQSRKASIVAAAAAAAAAGGGGTTTPSKLSRANSFILAGGGGQEAASSSSSSSGAVALSSSSTSGRRDPIEFKPPNQVFIHGRCSGTLEFDAEKISFRFDMVDCTLEELELITKRICIRATPILHSSEKYYSNLTQPTDKAEEVGLILRKRTTATTTTTTTSAAGNNISNNNKGQQQQPNYLLSAAHAYYRMHPMFLQLHLRLLPPKNLPRTPPTLVHQQIQVLPPLVAPTANTLVIKYREGQGKRPVGLFEVGPGEKVTSTTVSLSEPDHWELGSVMFRLSRNATRDDFLTLEADKDMKLVRISDLLDDVALVGGIKGLTVAKESGAAASAPAAIAAASVKDDGGAATTTAAAASASASAALAAKAVKRPTASELSRAKQSAALLQSACKNPGWRHVVKSAVSYDSYLVIVGVRHDIFALVEYISQYQLVITFRSTAGDFSSFVRRNEVANILRKVHYENTSSDPDVTVTKTIEVLTSNNSFVHVSRSYVTVLMQSVDDATELFRATVPKEMQDRQMQFPRVLRCEGAEDRRGFCPVDDLLLDDPDSFVFNDFTVSLSVSNSKTDSVPLGERIELLSVAAQKALNETTEAALYAGAIDEAKPTSVIWALRQHTQNPLFRISDSSRVMVLAANGRPVGLAVLSLQHPTTLTFHIFSLNDTEFPDIKSHEAADAKFAEEMLKGELKPFERATYDVDWAATPASGDDFRADPSIAINNSNNNNSSSASAAAGSSAAKAGGKKSVAAAPAGKTGGKGQASAAAADSKPKPAGKRATADEAPARPRGKDPAMAVPQHCGIPLPMSALQELLRRVVVAVPDAGGKVQPDGNNKLITVKIRSKEGADGKLIFPVIFHPPCIVTPPSAASLLVSCSIMANQQPDCIIVPRFKTAAAAAPKRRQSAAAAAAEAEQQQQQQQASNSNVPAAPPSAIIFSSTASVLLQPAAEIATMRRNATLKDEPSFVHIECTLRPKNEAAIAAVKGSGEDGAATPHQQQQQHLILELDSELLEKAAALSTQKMKIVVATDAAASRMEGKKVPTADAIRMENEELQHETETTSVDGDHPVTHRIVEEKSSSETLFHVTQLPGCSANGGASFIRISATDDKHLSSSRLSEIIRCIKATVAVAKKPSTVDSTDQSRNSTQTAASASQLQSAVSFAMEQVYFCHVKLITFEGNDLAIKSFVVKF